MTTATLEAPAEATLTRPESDQVEPGSGGELRHPGARIEAALLAAQRSIKAVGKSSFNEYSKYSYASSDQILAASREALHNAGISFRMEDFWIEEKHNSRWAVCLFILTHTESMETIKTEYSWPIIQSGDKPKPLDKALGGALTTATRYYLRGLLSIPQVDGNEEMAARPDPSDNDHGGEEPMQGGPSKEQIATIKRLVAETGAIPASLEASFGPADSLTYDAAKRVINYLNGLKEKGAKQ
jgi:hypothetical protein